MILQNKMKLEDYNYMWSTQSYPIELDVFNQQRGNLEACP